MDHVEIERKYLIDTEKLPDLATIRAFHIISQGYLPTEPCTRIRIIGDQAYMTVKGSPKGSSGGPLVRSESEHEIPIVEANQLWLQCRATLSKIRYEIPYEGRIWEVDRFVGPLEGLWLAEVELESEDAEVRLPPWVTREVTDDPRYANSRLAAEGIPKP